MDSETISLAAQFQDFERTLYARSKFMHSPLNVDGYLITV